MADRVCEPEASPAPHTSKNTRLRERQMDPSMETPGRIAQRTGQGLPGRPLELSVPWTHDGRFPQHQTSGLLLLDEMWDINAPAITKVNEVSQYNAELRKAIKGQAEKTGIDVRIILALVMQEVNTLISSCRIILKTLLAHAQQSTGQINAPLHKHRHRLRHPPNPRRSQLLRCLHRPDARTRHPRPPHLAGLSQLLQRRDTRKCRQWRHLLEGQSFCGGEVV